MADSSSPASSQPSRPSASKGVWPAGTPPPDAPLYPVDLTEDVRAARPAKLVAVRVDGALFYADMESRTLYDHEALRLHNRVVKVGKLPL